MTAPSESLLASRPESGPGAEALEARRFDFGGLGHPRSAPVPAQVPPPAPSATGQLEELSADDILESDDILETDDILESEHLVSLEPALPVAPNSSGFVVGELSAFEDVQVEGGVPAAALPVAPVPAAALPVAPVPAAPLTSPLPLESVIVTTPAVEKTQELHGGALAQVAAVVAQLESGPGQTEVLHRSQMPAALQAPYAHALSPTPPHAGPRPGSMAPVAVDMGAHQGSIPMAFGPAAHAPMAANPAAARRSGLSGLAIAGIIAAAFAFVGLVGAGGFVASRTLSGREAVATATTEGASPGAAPVTAATPAAPVGAESPSGAASPADPVTAASAPGIDVSSLPSAAAPSTAPHGLVATGGATPGARSAGASQPSSASGVKVTTLVTAPAPSDKAAAQAIPAAAPPPPAAPAAPAPAPVVASTGVVHVDANLRAVVVDGSYLRVSEGAVTVSCGTHKIKAGMDAARVVNVPCGGAVTL